MSSTNKTTHYELSQYIGTDKPTYLGDYNADMLAIDTAIYNASDAASTAVSTANSAASTASDAATASSAATTTANSASDTANLAKTTAETASTNASAALTAAQGAQTAAAANTITNLAPAYDPTLTYSVDYLVTFIDEQGSGKLYKCIVDIAVPEAFNINKWDDVTASEAFSEKMRSVTSECDGVKTRSVVLNDLFAEINLDNINPMNATLVRNLHDGSARNLKLGYITSTEISFNNAGVVHDGTLCEIVMVKIRSTGSEWKTTQFGADTMSVVDNSTSVDPVGDSFTLYF